MILAEIVLNNEIIIFIGTIAVVIVSVLLYMNRIDNRVTILETDSISKDEFYKKMDEIKDSIVDSVQREIRNFKIMNHNGNRSDEN